MEAATNTLRSMFPKSSADQCVSALKVNNWDLSATIDYMLAQTATEEQQVQQQQQQVNPSIPPPPPPPQQTIPPPLPANVIESEEDKLLKEFLFLEQQIHINRIPTPPPYNPSTNNIKPSIAVVEKVEPISIPPPPPLPQPIVHEHQPQQQEQEQQQEEEQQEKQQEEEPKTRENNSLLRNITNTLKELENEVRNLVMEKKPQPNVVETVETVETTETVISNNNNNNNLENIAQNNIEQLVEKVEQVEQEQEEQEEEQENNENNNNNNSQIPNEVKVAIDQLESLFNSSLEKTEKILNELKEEITSWKIKDNVKTFTVTVRNELSDMLASLANYISPEQTQIQIQRKEAKRQELENKLKELKEHNRNLEEERRIAIEKIENKYKQQTTTTTTTTSSGNQIPPPPPYPEENSEQ
ncbi:hypothetical protein ACTFIW_007608 [Dictyostelium discoideum]